MKNFFILFFLFSLFLLPVRAEESANEKSIRENRMGEIVVKAKPGAEISVEQLKHEFWFGCAISDGIFNGSSSEYNQ
ncbi:MAG: hypothetical protein ACOC1D_03165 [Prolixibacteraceae bacterium]